MTIQTEIFNKITLCPLVATMTSLSLMRINHMLNVRFAIGCIFATLKN